MSLPVGERRLNWSKQQIVLKKPWNSSLCKRVSTLKLRKISRVIMSYLRKSHLNEKRPSRGHRWSPVPQDIGVHPRPRHNSQVTSAEDFPVSFPDNYQKTVTTSRWTLITRTLSPGHQECNSSRLLFIWGRVSLETLTRKLFRFLADSLPVERTRDPIPHKFSSLPYRQGKETVRNKTTTLFY